MKEPKPTEAMDIEQESATACKSLSLMDEEVMLNRKSPPCHQTMDLIDRQGSQQDGNRDYRGNGYRARKCRSMQVTVINGWGSDACLTENHHHATRLWT
jgi:hypothetical protein